MSEPALVATHSVRFVFFDHGGTLAHIKKNTPEITFEILQELDYDFSQEQVNRAIASAEAFGTRSIDLSHEDNGQTLKTITSTHCSI